MKYFKILTLASLTLFSSLFSLQKKVEIVATWKINESHLTELLAQNGVDAKVIATDLLHYKGIIYDKSKLGNFLRSLSLDLPLKVAVPEDVERIVIFNSYVHFRKNRALFQKKLELGKLPKEKLVLFLWEPPCQGQKLYQPQAHECFSKVYTWKDDLVDNKKYFKFFYPVYRPMIENIVPFEEKKLLTLVTSSYTSDLPNTLYKERKNAIDFFEKIDGGDFVFYGKDWDPSLYKNYGGAIQDKTAIIKNFRFSICYESTCNIKGYITEKIFDCFAAGNVPIYWGASNIEEYVPKGCFIDRTDFNSLEDLYSFLKNMSKEEYEGYLNRIKAYLDTDKAKLFSMENFSKIFAEAVSGK